MLYCRSVAGENIDLLYIVRCGVVLSHCRSVAGENIDLPYIYSKGWCHTVVVSQCR